MLATQEAQVIPVMRMKHFCTSILAELVVVEPAPLLATTLWRGFISEGSEGLELTWAVGPEFSRLWVPDAGSEEEMEQRKWLWHVVSECEFAVTETGWRLKLSYPKKARPGRLELKNESAYNLLNSTSWQAGVSLNPTRKGPFSLRALPVILESILVWFPW